MQSIAAQLAKIAKRSSEDLTNVVKASLIRLDTMAVLNSPVLDGFFKNGWLSSVGDFTEIERGRADKSGIDSLNDLKITISKMELGQTFFFVNPSPYGFKIEYKSHSAQAPNGVVRVAALEFDRFVTEEVRKRS